MGSALTGDTGEVGAARREAAALSDAATLDATLGEDIRQRPADAGGAHELGLFEAGLLGGRLGRFCVLDKLGEGGMGVVLAAHDEQLDRRVALKLLTRTRRDAAAGERLVREARSLARLSHPNIVSVYEVGESDGVPYLAMELVVGTTLGAWLEGDGVTPAPSRLEVFEMFRAIGRGLAAAHEVGVVHRDFKPDNVLVGADGRPRIVDFGLAQIARGGEPAGAGSGATAQVEPADLNQLTAQLTAHGAVVGTPAYMAPEQWSGLPADARSDQFGFCVTLFHAVYGRAPFAGESMAALMTTVVEDDPVQIPGSERLPDALHQAILRGLAKQPSERWPSMNPLLQHIDDALAAVQPGLFTGPLPMIAHLLGPLLMGFPVVLLALELADVVPYAARSWAYLSGAQVVLMLSIVLGLRRYLLARMGDHRVIALPWMVALFFLGHRVIALAIGSSIEAVFAYDFLGTVGISSIMTYLVDRRLWPVIVFNVVLLVCATTMPSWAPRLWLVFCLGMPIVVIGSVSHTKDRLRGDGSLSRSGRSSGSAQISEPA